MASAVGLGPESSSMHHDEIWGPLPLSLAGLLKDTDPSGRSHLLAWEYLQAGVHVITMKAKGTGKEDEFFYMKSFLRFGL